MAPSQHTRGYRTRAPRDCCLGTSGLFFIPLAFLNREKSNLLRLPGWPRHLSSGDCKSQPKTGQPAFCRKVWVGHPGWAL